MTSTGTLKARATTGRLLAALVGRREFASESAAQFDRDVLACGAEIIEAKVRDLFRHDARTERELLELLGRYFASRARASSWEAR